MLKFLLRNISWMLLLGWGLTSPVIARSPQNLNKGTFRETVWLQTTGHLFISGDRLNFKAVLLEKDTYKPSVLSKNIRIELLDSTGAGVFKQNYALANSRVSYSFSLNPELKSGWYYLRAYTNWMRNFPDSEFTVVAIKIVNPSEKRFYTESPALTDHQPLTTVPSGMMISAAGNNLVVEMDNPAANTSKYLRLLVHRSYSWYWYDSLPNTGNPLKFSVPANSIPEGIVQFSVLSDNNTVLAGRLWSGYNLDNHRIEITSATENIKIRSTHQVEFELPQQIAATGSTLFSMVSLTEPGNHDEDFMPGLPGWDAGGKIPCEKKEFEKWLSRNRYPDETVQAFFKTDQPEILFMPETRTGILSGRVTDKKTGKGVPSAGVSATILNDNSFQAVHTNPNGVFSFSFPGGVNSGDYILSFIAQPDSFWEIGLNPEFDNRAFKPVERLFSLSPEEIKYAGNLSVNMQLNQVYDQSEGMKEVKSDSLPWKKSFFYPPEWTINTADYIELANVLEVVYEVVPDVQVRRKGNDAHLSVYNKNISADNYETLILLDGMPITSHKQLLDLPPARIKTIEVKNQLYLHGNYIFSAVVNFISLNGDFAGLPLPVKSVSGSMNLPVNAEADEQRISAPASPDIPILTPVIIWNTGTPSSVNKLEIPVNDLYGTFKVMIYGLDQNGQWFYGTHSYQVKPPTL